MPYSHKMTENINEPLCDKYNELGFTPGEDSDQHEHPHPTDNCALNG